MSRYKWTVEFSEEDSQWYLQKLVNQCPPSIYSEFYDSEDEAQAQADRENDLDEHIEEMERKEDHAFDMWKARRKGES